MTKFNYKKWLTENREGKPNINYINEQQEFFTYHGCSVCPEGAVIDEVPENWSIYGLDISGQPMCYPVVSFDIPSSDIQNNDDYSNDVMVLNVSSPSYTSEYIGSDENILIYDRLRLSPDMSCSGSGGVEGGEDTAIDCYTCPAGEWIVTSSMALNSNYTIPSFSEDVCGISSGNPYYPSFSGGTLEWYNSQEAWEEASGSCGGGGNETEFTGDYTDPGSYFDNPTGFCADNPDVEYDVYWFITETPMCEQCANDPIENAAIQCCCCPDYDGLPQQAINYYAENNMTFDAWGGPNQCDGSTLPPTSEETEDDPLAEILTWTCNPGTTNILDIYEVNTYLGPSFGYVPEVCDVQYLYDNLTYVEGIIDTLSNVWQGDDGTDGCCVTEDWEYWPTGGIGGMPSPQGMAVKPPKPSTIGSKDKKMKLDKDIKKSLKEFKYKIKRTINNLKRKK